MDQNAGIRLSSGVPGLDEILTGGLIPGRAYLVRGGPGTGKTIIGLHFLVAGAANNERTLLITMAEPEVQLRRSAEAIGFDLKNIPVLDLSPTSDYFAKMKTYDIFAPSEVEHDPITRAIVERIETIQPQRVFIDTLTQFRYLSTDAFQFRRQVLSFLRYLIEKNATVVFSSESSERDPDADLQFMSDGIIHLSNPEEWRYLCISKFRGSDYRPGLHAMRISKAGMRVFPKLSGENYRQKFEFDVMSSGVTGLDDLLHGGIERATINFLTGPSGTGKTSIGLQFIKEAAARGGRSVLYSFEEEIEIMLRRADSIGISARALKERGTLQLVKIEPMQYFPDEFARIVRREVEEQLTRIVMIDSVAGYRHAMRLGEEEAINHLFALCKYLQNMGVTVIVINETEGGWSENRSTATKMGYLADNIIFLRYLERRTEGSVELRKAVGVLKKRLSDFDKSLREVEITREGLHVGKPLRGISEILGSSSEWEPPRRPFLRSILAPTGE